jgi:apolipoprotein N-acyltransferase
MLGKPTPTRLAALLGLAAVWVIIEWTRTWFLGGFPWLPLAASQWTMVSMLQIAAFTGAGGVSFVVVAVNLGFAAYAHRLFREGATGLNKRSQEFFLALFLVLVCFSVHVQQTFNRVFFNVPLGRVAIVQPYIPQTLKWDPAQDREILDVLVRETMKAAASKPDLILWPEAATPWKVRGDDAMRRFVEDLARRAGVPIVLGSIAIERAAGGGNDWYNGAFVVTPDHGLQAEYYAKRRLVPFGEFVPLRFLLGWLEKVVPVGGDFTPGTSAAPLSVPVRGESLAVGTLICYEDIYPALSRDEVRADASALVVLTNNGWFGEGGAAQQHAAHSVLRAVETRRPLIRCGNGGWSGWIDEFGAVRSVATDEKGSIYFRGTKTINVTRDSRWIGQDSVFVAHGQWFLLVSAGLVLFAFLLLKTSDSARPSA